MARVKLGRADLALWDDPDVHVVIPVLYAATRERQRAGVLVQFEGDEYPTAFRGASRTGSLQLTCRYPAAAAADRLRLVQLLDELAPERYDSRLLLRLHFGLPEPVPADLRPFAAGTSAVAVQVFGLTETPVDSAEVAIDVSFTAQIVQHSFDIDVDRGTAGDAAGA
jgi:hypothetical protein